MLHPSNNAADCYQGFTVCGTGIIWDSETTKQHLAQELFKNQPRLVTNQDGEQAEHVEN